MMETVSSWLKEYREAEHLDQQLHAVEKLIGLVNPELHRFISAGCPLDSVDDVLQATLIAIARSLHKFRGDEEFMAWCKKIATRKRSDFYRAEAKRQAQPLDEEEIWHLIESSSVPITARQRERLEEALELMTRSKPPCADFLKLRFFYGMEHDEIGKVMGKSRDAARLQVRRCIELAKSLVSNKGVINA